VWAPGIPEWEFLQLSAARAGIVLVPLNPSYKRGELLQTLGQSGASAVFIVDEFRGNSLRSIVEGMLLELPELRHVFDLRQWRDFVESTKPGLLPSVTGGDVLQILYTSGTTGVPKGAILTQGSAVNNVKLVVDRVGVGPRGRWLNPLPMFHAGGCVFNALGCLATDATHILMPEFDAAVALSLLEREEVTFLNAVPTMLTAIMNVDTFTTSALSSLALLLSGGTSIPPALVHTFEETFGARFCMVYGQSEAGPTVCLTAPEDSIEVKSKTIGFPLPHTEVKIVEPRTRETLEFDQIGELCVRGYNVMQGYYEMPEETGRVIDEDGWLSTGDLCVLEPSGYLRFAGRSKEVIIRGGENIAPREIEEVVMLHPTVADVAVVGLPDLHYGEVVAAFVIPGSSWRSSDPKDIARDLAAYVTDAIAHYKVPAAWYVVEEFPKTPSGKVQKFLLRQLAVSGRLEPSLTRVR
jgi:fatty-acyl-CoA synthase